MNQIFTQKADAQAKSCAVCKYIVDCERNDVASLGSGSID